MLLEVTRKKANPYPYRNTLWNLGLRPQGRKWTLTTSDNSLCADFVRFCKHNHLDYNVIEDQYVRSTTYRQEFFSAYPPKHGHYRCVYCGRRITPQKMSVDHIVPIHKVQNSSFYRWLLRRMKINNVNDTKNLAPSCEKCNKRKSSKFTLKYYFLAKSGKQPHGIAFRRCVKFICGMSIAFLVAWTAFLLFVKSVDMGIIKI